MRQSASPTMDERERTSSRQQEPCQREHEHERESSGTSRQRQREQSSASRHRDRENERSSASCQRENERSSASRQREREHERASTSRQRVDEMPSCSVERTASSRAPSVARPPTLQEQLYEMQETMHSLSETVQLLRPRTASETTRPRSQHDDLESLPPAREISGMMTDDITNDHLAMLAHPMPRPVVSAGVDITAHVSATMKAKVWRDEYLDLHLLLPANSYQQESYTLAFDPTQSHQVGLKVNKPKPKNLTISQWEDAYLIYMAIYTTRHPTCAPQMCAYMQDIRMLAKESANFRLYDEQFRQFRASTHCEWNTIHQGIWFQATNPVRMSNGRPNNSTSNNNNRNYKQPFQAPRGFCNSYHSKFQTCNFGSKCRYKHTCPHCQERHPMFNCNDKSKSKNEQHGNKQQSSRTNNTSQPK